MFDGLFSMKRSCPRCELPFEREPGYFIGAIYINYGLTVLLALGGSFLLEYLWRPPVGVQLAIWVAFCVLFPLLFFRHSKSLWLSFEYFVNPEEGPHLRRVR